METDKHLNELAYDYSESIYHIDDSETVLCEDLEKAEQAKEHFKNGYKVAKSEIIEKLEDIIYDFVDNNFFYHESTGDYDFGEPHVEYSGEDDDMKEYGIWPIYNTLMDKIKKEL